MIFDCTCNSSIPLQNANPYYCYDVVLPTAPVVIVQWSNVPTLANSSPNITVDKVFNVTAGQANFLKVNTSDPDSDTVNIKCQSSVPKGANFKGGIYTWSPVNMESVNITYVYYYELCLHISAC